MFSYVFQMLSPFVAASEFILLNSCISLKYTELNCIRWYLIILNCVELDIITTLYPIHYIEY